MTTPVPVVGAATARTAAVKLPSRSIFARCITALLARIKFLEDLKPDKKAVVDQYATVIKGGPVLEKGRHLTSRHSYSLHNGQSKRKLTSKLLKLIIDKYPVFSVSSIAVYDCYVAFYLTVNVLT